MLVAFKRIKAAAEASSGAMTALILSAIDCDSLCACHIFQQLLKAEFIPYSLVPVDGYTDLKASIEVNMTSNDDLTSIIMINCGANIDVRVRIKSERVFGLASRRSID